MLWIEFVVWMSILGGGLILFFMGCIIDDVNDFNSPTATLMIFVGFILIMCFVVWCFIQGIIWIVLNFDKIGEFLWSEM